MMRAFVVFHIKYFRAAVVGCGKLHGIGQIPCFFYSVRENKYTLKCSIFLQIFYV